MKIRHTQERDIPRIMEIYARARQFMAEHGNPNQWGPNNWPPESLIRQDLDRGLSYVCESDDGRVIGTFFYTFGADVEPTYAQIDDGQWLDDSPYGAVHRIASDGSEPGIGKYCLMGAVRPSAHRHPRRQQGHAEPAERAGI